MVPMLLLLLLAICVLQLLLHVCVQRKAHSPPAVAFRGFVCCNFWIFSPPSLSVARTRCDVHRITGVPHTHDERDEGREARGRRGAKSPYSIFAL